LFAQREMMTFGVKAGAPVISSFEIDRAPASYQTNYQKLLIGLTYETPLTKSASIEADASYHPEKFRYHPPCIAQKSGCSSVNLNPDGYSLEFPLLLKMHRDLNTAARPFVETGLSGRSTTMSRETHWNLGFNLGAGVDFHGNGFHFYPEARYTHWFFDGELIAGSNMHQNLEDFRVFLGFSYAFRK
jgi:hypothetical protein